MQHFLTVGQQVLVLFLLILAGFVLGKRNIMNAAGAKVCADIALFLATPCVIIKSFQREYSPALMKGLLTALLVSALIHGVGIGLAQLIYRGDSARNRVFRLSAVFSNAGFMALPLQQAVLGETGVFYGAAYVVMFNLVLWSYGALMMDGSKQRLSWKKLLVNPGMIGLIAGLAVFVMPVPLPAILSAPIAHLAALNTPLPMLFIGYYLSTVNFGAALRQTAYYGGVAVRLLAVPVISSALLYLLGVRGVLLVSMTIAASAPTAAAVSMFAARYDGDTGAAVNLVALTTVASLITMPVLVAVAQLLP